MIHFTIYTHFEFWISPLLMLLCFCTCLLYLLPSFHSVFLSICKPLSLSLTHTLTLLPLCVSVCFHLQFSAVPPHQLLSQAPRKVEFCLQHSGVSSMLWAACREARLVYWWALWPHQSFAASPRERRILKQNGCAKGKGTVERAAESGLCSLNCWQMFFSVFRCYSPNVQV